MKFKDYLTEKTELSSMRSITYTGPLWRAEDSIDKSSAMGKGKYFTDTKETALTYGRKIGVYQARGLRVLGTNSRDYGDIQHRARAEQKKRPIPVPSMAQVIADVAQEEDWDAIYMGSVFGLVVFPKSMKKVRKT